MTVIEFKRRSLHFHAPRSRRFQSVHLVSGIVFQLLTCVVDVNYEARVKYAVGQGFYMLGNRGLKSSYAKAHY